MQTLLGSLRLLQTIALGLSVAIVPAAGALDPQRTLNQYGHQSWQTDSGLPQNTVHAVLQTRMDLSGWLPKAGWSASTAFSLWSTTRAECRHGEAAQQFRQQPFRRPVWRALDCNSERTHPPPGCPVQHLYRGTGPAEQQRVVGLSGSRWNRVGAYVGGTGVVRRRALPRLPIDAGLSSSSSIAEAADGTLWISTDAGVAKLKGGQLTEGAADSGRRGAGTVYQPRWTCVDGNPGRLARASGRQGDVVRANAQGLPTSRSPP